MSMIISEGRPSIPVIYRDWAEWRVFRREEIPLASGTHGTTVTCALCWGAGRYLDPAGNGEGLVTRSCPRCNGTGRVWEL